VNYVRGDRSNEAPNGSNFRVRTTVMGDLIHSTLLYWNTAAPPRSVCLWVAMTVCCMSSMRPMASRIFAYVPSMVIPNLKNLVNTPYSHNYYVDGGLTIATGTLGGSTAVLLAAVWARVVKACSV